MKRTVLTLSDLPDEPTPAQIMLLDRESLDQLEPTRVRWCCQMKDCQNGTHLLDFGIHPYYFLDRNSQESQRRPDKYWRKLDYHFFICGKHFRRYDLAVLQYGQEAVIHRMLDPLTIERKLSIPR